MKFIQTLQTSAKFLLTRAGYEFTPLHPRCEGISLWRRATSSRKASQHGGDSERRLVFVPGFGDTPLSWIAVVALVARSRRFKKMAFDEIVLLEFPGYLGSNSQQSCIPDADRLIAATQSLLDDLKPTVLVGHSMGGFLAAHYCANLERPRTSRTSNVSRPERVILFCPSGLAYIGKKKIEWQGTFENLYRGEVSDYVNKAIGAIGRHPLFRFPLTPIVRELGEFLSRKDVHAFLQSFDEKLELDQQVPKIQCPVSLYWGENDALIPFNLFKEWKRLLMKSTSGSKLRSGSISGAGHGVQLDRPNAVAKLILDDLESVAGI